MATNIGPKISVEGEAEYRKQMAQIIAQQRLTCQHLFPAEIEVEGGG